VTDAMDMFKAMRPPSPSISEDIRVAPQRTVATVGGSRDLHDLAMTPGSAAYRARIPKPPCYRCGEDHFPGRSYDHEWVAEPVPVHDEPVAATAVVRRPQVIDVAQPDHRVAVYIGRHDTYVVAVEQSPDWDNVQTFRVVEDQLLAMVQMARALGVKVQDKTGGDLMALEQEEDVSQHAQAHGRGAPSAGDRGARRSGLDADWQKAYRQSGKEPPHGDVSGEPGERDDPAG